MEDPEHVKATAHALAFRIRNRLANHPDVAANREYLTLARQAERALNRLHWLVTRDAAIEKNKPTERTPLI